MFSPYSGHFYADDDINTQTRNGILSIIDFVWKNAYFRFENNFYKRLQGSPMSAKLSPMLGNLFLDHTENKARKEYVSFLVYYRYVDDIFLIWKRARFQ